MGNFPKIICDTGHNIGGMQYIVRQLNSEKFKTLRIVIGMVNDKDINGVLSILPQNAVYYFTQASIPRALPAQDMMQKGLAHGLSGACYITVEDAYKQALTDSDREDLIFIGGSTFIVAAFTEYETKKYINDATLIRHNHNFGAGNIFGIVSFRIFDNFSAPLPHI